MDVLRHIMDWLNQHYTLMVVTTGTGLLCLGAGVVGAFTFLRKRALIGDAISHAVLPGVAVAFMLSGVKDPFYFVLGAAISGLLAVWVVDYVQQHSKLKPDTILALTLSVFFGLGIVLLTYIQHEGNAAQSGLDSFLFGKAASMNLKDIQVFSVIAVVNIILIFVFERGFTLLSFDEMFAKGLRFNTAFLKSLLSVLTVITVAVGVQAVGVVLMAALLITPAAGARFLTNNIRIMLVYSGLLGAVSGMLGTYISSVGTGMPTGPWIVISLTLLSFVAILFGKEKGLLKRIRLRKQNKRKIDNENVLKSLYKLSNEGQLALPVAALQEQDPLQSIRLRSAIKRLKAAELLEWVQNKVILTSSGILAAREVVRKHRLWELYLSKYFQLPSDHLHDDAEGIEHVITPEIEKHLTELLEYPDRDPHESEIPY